MSWTGVWKGVSFVRSEILYTILLLNVWSGHVRDHATKVADSLTAHEASDVCSGSEIYMNQVSDYVTSLVSGELFRVTG